MSLKDFYCIAYKNVKGSKPEMHQTAWLHVYNFREKIATLSPIMPQKVVYI